MTITANAQGRLSGTFTIPTGVPSGSKLVHFHGAESEAMATFVGRGVVQIEELRQVTSIVDRRLLTWVGDPLAQTFIVPPGLRKQVAAVDLWFAAIGTTNVLVQIRDVSLGVPTLDVVCEALLTPAEITTDGPTRFRFPPTLLDPGREYAVVVACNDAVSALHVAGVGEFDADAQRWITAQPYQIGVLLSSSNNRTWTPHQTRDLAFRLIAADYDVATNTTEAGATRRTVTLAPQSVAAADYLMVMAAVERPASECDVAFRLGVGGATYTVAEGQPVVLPEPYSGPVTMAADLVGSFTASPRLHRDVVLVAGTRNASGTYITRAIQTQLTGLATGTLKVWYDAILPSTSGVDVHYESAPGVWSSVPIAAGGATDLGNGWVEVQRAVAGLGVAETRVRLTLSGSQSALPRVRNLRVAIT